MSPPFCSATRRLVRRLLVECELSIVVTNSLRKVHISILWVAVAVGELSAEDGDVVSFDREVDVLGGGGEVYGVVSA